MGQRAGGVGNARVKTVEAIVVPDSWGYWFSGFVDGEGCFSINVKKTTNGRISPRFSLSQRRDAILVLEEIREMLGMGTVSPSGPRAAQFWMGSVARCLALCALFHKYPLRTKKRVDLEMWETILWRMNSSPCLTAADVAPELAIMARIKRMT